MAAVMSCAIALAVFITFGLAAESVSAQEAGALQGGEVARLKSRVEQLEEQLVDLRVIIGTLESLAKTPSARVGQGGSTSGGGSDSRRVAILETQIGALTAQLERLAAEVRAGAAAGGRRISPGKPSTNFGSTTVTPSRGDDRIGNIISRNNQPKSPQGADRQGGPESAYRDAYGYWLRRDYRGAKLGFEKFLKGNPRHRLAGDAQYWLGESYFKLGKFQLAAKAFLTGYQTYSASQKAPDSLLQLAASLDRLGERGAACTSLGELRARFPQADQRVIRRLRSELRRMGC